MELYGGGRADLVMGFLLSLSLFLPVESSCWHPVKKFDQKNWRMPRLKNRPTISALHLC